MTTILAIDDNPDNLISLKAIIHDSFPASTIFTAQNGPEGIKLAIENNPDVILLDIIMPVMDGFEVCQRLKSDERVSNIPVVFLTALGGEKRSRIRALEVGADAFLSKPIDEAELTAQIRAMVKIKAAQEQKLDEKLRLEKLVAERTAALETELNERKRMEESLRESEYFFKESQHAAFIGSYNFNLISNYWTSSEVLNEIFGIEGNYDKTMQGWLGIVHPEDRTTMESYFNEEIVAQRKTFNREYRIIRKSDDEVRWVLGLGKLTFDDQGNIVSMIGTIQDITERKQAENELHQSNQLNRSLLQTIPFGMDIVDEFGNLLFISDNLKKHLQTDHLGKKCWELYRDDRTQCATCPLVKGIKVGETDLYESYGVLGGKTFQISHTGMMYQGKKAMLEIFQDITEKKEIEKKVRLLAHSLESISECVSITDSDDLIVYVNKSFLHTYGYNKGEVIGQHTCMLRPGKIATENVRDILQQTIEGGWRGEIMNKKKDGTLFPILLSTSIIKDDNDAQIALIGVALDISEMRQAREELIRAKEQAEEGNRLKTAFLNNMSHEIRTPMNHIMGFASIMTEAQGSEKDAYAEIILNSSNQLLTLIEDVILLSRLQSEKTAISVREFSPEMLITNTISMFNSGNTGSTVPLNIRIPSGQPYLTVYSDNEKIKHILTNLVSNAIKYTFEGSIELGFEVFPEEITFYVKDTGIGIPVKEQQHIFESFYRGDQALSLVIGGTGLGLSIVKELVRALNGRLNLESEPGKGSCFSFTIPYVQSPDGKYSESGFAKPHKPMKELILLVADDEEVNFLYLEILMKNSVMRMDHAINGKVAVEMIRKDKYDIILMDLKMPEMDGYEATRILKQEFPLMPVIAQTAYTSAEDKEKAKLAGFDDFISKPINKDAIMDLILKYS